MTDNGEMAGPRAGTRWARGPTAHGRREFLDQTRFVLVVSWYSLGMESTTTPAQPGATDDATIAAWYTQVELAVTAEEGLGAVLKDLADDATWEWLRETMLPAEAAAWVLAGDGLDDDMPPTYYADEMAAGR